MTVYHHKDDIASTVFSPQNAFFSHQAKDWGVLPRYVQGTSHVIAEALAERAASGEATGLSRNNAV
jgi:hypothetical protein